MRVIAYQNGVAQLQITTSDWKDILSITNNAIRLEAELLDLSGFELPAIDTEVINQLVIQLNDVVKRGDGAVVLAIDRPMAIYLDVILCGAASRGAFVEFPNNDGELIKSERKLYLSDQLHLIRLGFNSEETIQKLEQIDNLSIPKFQQGRFD